MLLSKLPAIATCWWYNKWAVNNKIKIFKEKRHT